MERSKQNNITGKLNEYKEAELATDGETIIVKCSSCKIELAEIWMIRPSAPITSDIVAECPHCGDKSFKINVSGQYCLGHVESGKTLIVDTPTDFEKLENGVIKQNVLIKTRKG